MINDFLVTLSTEPLILLLRLVLGHCTDPNAWVASKAKGISRLKAQLGTAIPPGFIENNKAEAYRLRLDVDIENFDELALSKCSLREADLARSIAAAIRQSAGSC
jgi:hypothetical protein